ncbi:MAG: N4-(beta-N-acetylglucosaminyl)-L-asparaginase [Arcticibacterium sp.]|jgi:N4-(beta-N-acetylglucosaminyl)-L-asparaginase
MQRRKFIQKAGLSVTALAAVPLLAKEIKTAHQNTHKPFHLTAKNTIAPLTICTWNFHNATSKSWEILKAGGSALDAVEQGVMIEESDLSNQTVGKGGRPDRDGHVTLDACIMDPKGNCGAVIYLKNIAHPIQVARKVMEETPHVMLAGEGAEQFAYEMGFKKDILLTPQSKSEWEAWKVTSKYSPIINIENHDTIGMLAIDKNGDISGACTTSGMAYKMAGRVGDSPLIGAGLFVDNEIGAATATGVGEEVVKTVGSFLIVELMRQGMSPQEACEEAVMRIVKKNPSYSDFQVGFIALNKKGDTGAYCIQPGFSYSYYANSGQENRPATSYI